MKKQKILSKIFGVGLVFVLIVSMVGGLPASVKEVQASPGTIWVPDDYATIQAAVNAAISGDTIIVRDNTYDENVDVGTDHLTIQSENGPANCIVNAANPTDDVFDVTANWTNITGFTVENATDWRKAGICLSNVNHCTITNNTASNDNCGIHLYNSNNNTFTNNTAWNNNWNGIRLDYSDHNVLTDNNASNNYHGIRLSDYSNNNTFTNNNAWNNYFGIRLSYSSNNTLTNNTMSENTYNFYVYGDSLSQYVQNIDTSNKVDGKPIYYWVNHQDEQVPGDAGFVGVVDSTNITIKDLNLTRNGQGVLIAYTDNSRIENVTALNNYCGIDLYYSGSNILTNDTISNNEGGGIWLSHSSSNTLTNNAVSNNGYYGIDLYFSHNNDFTNNTVRNNGDGIDLGYSRYNSLTNNTALNNYGCGIGLDVNSNYNTLTNNTALNNECGIELRSSRYNTVTSNIASNNDYGIYLYFSSSNNITNNTVSNNLYYGIELWGIENNNFDSNIVSNNGDGIHLYKSGGITLTNNIVSSNDHYGIWLWDTGSNNLNSNTVSNNDYGIYLNKTSSNTLTSNTVSNNNNGIYLFDAGSGSTHISISNTLINNTMSDNRYNFGVSGSSLSDYIQNIDTSNKVDGKPIYYWVNHQDKQVPGDAGFVGVVNSTNITVKDLNLTKNRQGMLFAYTDNSRIENVTTSKNYRGIYLYKSSGSTLTNNNASNNDKDGIRLYYSSSNHLIDNTASSNANGILLYDSRSNVIIDNNAWNNYDDGIYLGYSSNSNTVTNNNASNNDDGIYLNHSHNNNLSNNNVSNNNDGVYLCKSSGNTITNNTASNNDVGGIRLEYSSDRNTITKNIASNNYYGIYLLESSNNILTNNIVSINDHYGIWLNDSSSDTIYLNNFINNADGNVNSTNSTNTWNSTEQIAYGYQGTDYTNYLGNYWSDYNGSDPDGDGIGNSSYLIVNDNNDTYPLMESFENYQPGPPANITDLAVNKTAAHSITLNWTAPGDDGNTGTASEYDIRYSFSLINETNWDSAINCTGEPVPQSVGNTEFFNVTGLSSGTTYYFALKTRDEVPNWAGLSNIAEGTTKRPPSGGGGGGGGGAPSYSLTLWLFDTASQWRINSDGSLREIVEAASEDGKVVIYMTKDTLCLNEDQDRLETISVNKEDNPPPALDHSFLLETFNLTPVGATFVPPMTLVWSYNLEALLEDTDEENLAVACYDNQTKNWVELPSEIDTANQTIKASIRYFTTFAIMGKVIPPAPAEFTATSLDVTPGEVKPGEPVTISAKVTNVGGSEGSYAVNLSVNGDVEQTRTVTLAAGAVETVTFNIIKGEPGNYSVSIAGWTEEFTVVVPPLWIVRYWWMIVGGIIVVLLLVYLSVFRRKRARPAAAE